MSVAVIYGSAMGNTEGAANTIASKLGISDVFNISDIDAAKMNSYDKLICELQLGEVVIYKMIGMVLIFQGLVSVENRSCIWYG